MNMTAWCTHGSAPKKVVKSRGLLDSVQSMYAIQWIAIYAPCVGLDRAQGKYYQCVNPERA